MQHVTQRHTTQAVIQHTSTGLLLAALTGDMTGPLAYGLQSARVLGQLQYSRRAEARADEEGLRMLEAARIDPAGMIRFFDTLVKEDRQPANLLKYLSTHPNPVDRIERLKALVTKAPRPPVPLLPDTDWEDIKKICAPARG
jgi:predicted Zn-dependent protease